MPRTCCEPWTPEHQLQIKVANKTGKRQAGFAQGAPSDQILKGKTCDWALGGFNSGDFVQGQHLWRQSLGTWGNNRTPQAASIDARRGDCGSETTIQVQVPASSVSMYDHGQGI